MGRKRKYENALVAKDILAAMANDEDDIHAATRFMFLDLSKEDERLFLKKNIEFLIGQLYSAVKELEV